MALFFTLFDNVLIVFQTFKRLFVNVRCLFDKRHLNVFFVFSINLTAIKEALNNRNILKFLKNLKKRCDKGYKKALIKANVYNVI